jgi:predicted nucleic-acid-binding Zn-ribbon protein
MNKKRIFIIVIVLLIISNAFTIFLLVKGKNHRNHPPFISEKIGLTGEKLAKVKKIEENHFVQMKPLTAKIHLKQAELFSSIANSNVSKQDSLKNEISNLESERQNALFEHFRTIYEICSMEEKKKLLEEINNHFSKQKHPR